MLGVELFPYNLSGGKACFEVVICVYRHFNTYWDIRFAAIDLIRLKCDLKIRFIIMIRNVLFQ